MENLRVLPIHKNYKYMYECVKLLNSEWPRSVTARLSSFEPSCDSLPTCLMMIYTYKTEDQDVRKSNATEGINDNEEEVCRCGEETYSEDEKEFSPPVPCLVCTKNRREAVVGHSKVSRLCCVPDGCLIESVLIHKDYRGRGWGKYLMEQTELFIKNLGGIRKVYLTTTDKKLFYRKIGYKVTEPIPLFGTSWSINSAFKNLFLSSDTSQTKTASPTETNQKQVVNTETNKPGNCIINNGGEDRNGDVRINYNGDFVKIPVPPPMPSFSHCTKRRHVKKNHTADSRKIFMVKKLSK